MTMPHSAKGARAQRRAMVRVLKKARSKLRIVAAEARAREARAEEAHGKRYFRLSERRLLELLARLPEPYEPPEELDESDPAYD